LGSLSEVEQHATIQEIQSYAGMTMVLALQVEVVLKQGAATTPLLMDEDQHQAINEDHYPAAE
jgi:hypothetical protein